MVLTVGGGCKRYSLLLPQFMGFFGTGDPVNIKRRGEELAGLKWRLKYLSSPDAFRP